MLRTWNLKSKSPHLAYLLMAIAISLVCNFSYLILLVSNQSDSNLRIQFYDSMNDNDKLNALADELVEHILLESLLYQ